MTGSRRGSSFHSNKLRFHPSVIPVVISTSRRGRSPSGNVSYPALPPPYTEIYHALLISLRGHQKAPGQIHRDRQAARDAEAMGEMCVCVPRRHAQQQRPAGVSHRERWLPRLQHGESSLYANEPATWQVAAQGLQEETPEPAPGCREDCPESLRARRREKRV